MIKANNSPYIIDKHYNEAKTFLSEISYGGELYDLFERNFIFRGHAEEEYCLKPSALRGNIYIENSKFLFKEGLDSSTRKQLIDYSLTEHSIVVTEGEILKDFFQLCDTCQLYIPEITRLRKTFCTGFDAEAYLKKEKWLPEEFYEIAALAQHYGLKTRLLDWTYDINVALYFASLGPMQKLDAREQLQRNHRLAQAHLKRNYSDPQIEIWALDMSVLYANKEQNIPLKIITPRHYDNDNMSSQRGCFTLWEIDKRSIEEGHIMIDNRSLDEQLSDFLIQYNVESKPYLYHITIPQKEAKKIYKYAKRNNVDAAHLFPGYAGVVRCINEDARML